MKFKNGSVFEFTDQRASKNIKAKGNNASIINKVIEFSKECSVSKTDRTNLREFAIQSE